MAGNSVVEFGSDYQYLGVVPTPGTLGLLAVALIVGRRRRRRQA
jgi:MYXO-CTERM domain-containing protein